MIRSHKIQKTLRIVVLLTCVLGAYFFASEITIEKIQAVADANKVIGALLFAGIMFATTVIAPLASLPLVPVVAMLIGPFLAALACFVGWTAGAAVAFLIGRYLGQPFLEQYVGIEQIKKIEKFIPQDTSFILIVMLRVMLPVDVLSYALGFLTTVSFRIYLLATMLGIFWFTLVFSYGGVALMNHDYVLLSSIGVASGIILYGSWRYVRSTIRKGSEK